MQEKPKMEPELSVYFTKIMSKISHIPAEPKANLGANLRNIMLQISQASKWEAPVATPPTNN